MNYKSTHRSILIVEDNLLFQRLIAGAISTVSPQREVQLCQTGASALEFINSAGMQLELALIDLGLPDISGIELIRILRKRFATLPVMVVSVVSSDQGVLEAIRAGAHGYIHKSDPQEAIANAIHDVLKGNYPISPSLARNLFRLAGAPVTSEDHAQYQLAPRESETLQLIARGLTYEEVATQMGIAVSTVQSNIRGLYRKLDAHSQLQAVNKARDAGLI